MATAACYLQPLVLGLLQFSSFVNTMPVYISTDKAVSPLSSNTPLTGQKLYLAMGLAVLIAILLPICLFFLRKHNLKRHNRECINHCSQVLPLAFETDKVEANTKCSDQADNSGTHQPFTHTHTSGIGSDGVSSPLSLETLLKTGRCARWFSLSELETATNKFAKENLIGEGLYGLVYKGYLQDGSAVVVKNLTDSRGHALKMMELEVEALGNITHRNLVKLIGFYAVGDKRSLVYEYVDNGNLEKWLHGYTGPTSPLTWDIRMKIAIDIAIGLAYLHHGMTPKAAHLNVKSSNVLLAKNWNAKLADFGHAKILKPAKRPLVTTNNRYASTDYANPGMYYEGIDVYSFGVLLMEIVTGRSPVGDPRKRGQMSLVDWFKQMVASRQGERLLDPKISVRPSQEEFARALLVCLRCMNVNKRPTMQQVVYLLVADVSSFYREPRPPMNMANWARMRMPLVNFLYKRVMMNQDRVGDDP